MNVLMISPSYDPIIGGAETSVKKLTLKLNEIGIHADIMTFNMNSKWNPKWRWEIKEEKGFRIYRVPALNPFGNITNPVGLFFKVNVIPTLSFRKILEDYDILHFHDEVDLTFPLCSYFINKPRVFHHRTLQATFNFYKKNILCRYILKKSDVHIANSKSTAEFLTKLSIKNNKIKILPNGVEINKFKPNTNKINNQILFVGRFEKRKGIHIILDSLKILDIPVNLVLIGPNLNDKYARDILSRIKEENKKGKHSIIYLGPTSHDELVKWYQESSIFVCPSIVEPFGIVNVEALSCETPVVASNVDGIPDIVENHKNGILIQPNNPVKLAEALEYLLRNSDIRIKFGKEGRKKVEREFSWEVIAIKLGVVYNEMLR